MLRTKYSIHLEVRIEKPKIIIKFVHYYFADIKPTFTIQ
jgi:hypothetical protein